jgi:hypothetical protein
MVEESCSTLTLLRKKQKDRKQRKDLGKKMKKTVITVFGAKSRNCVFASLNRP